MARPYFKTCPVCGAHLDPQERCNCQQPVSRAIHRDGLTATCPLFSHRSTYRGRYYINCSTDPEIPGVKTKHEYPTAEARNEVYAQYCCDHGCGCSFIQDDNDAHGAVSKEGETNDNC